MTVKRILFFVVLVAATGLAGYLLYGTLSQYSYDEIRESVTAIPLLRLAGALGFAAASYVCLTGFDYLGVLYAGKRLAYPRVALASFCGLSIGHNVGIAALSSGAVRYRFYSRWGLTAEDITKVVLLCGMTVGLGLVSLAAVGLCLRPEEAGHILGLGRSATLALAAVCLAVPIVYVLLSATLRTPLRIRKWSLQLPDWRLAIGQIFIGTLNFTCVAACLYQTLAAFSDAGFVKVAAAYVLANMAAVVSHVPGGVGVLEATVLYILPGAASVGALIAFRVIYFFIPLFIGVPLFLVSEAVLKSRDGIDPKLQAEAS